jgi:cytochrome c-type biogenesis protein CcmH
VTIFVIVCAAMVAAALAWTTFPLFAKQPADEKPNVGERRTTLAALAIGLPVLAIVMYASLSTWDWDDASRAAKASGGATSGDQQSAAHIKTLEERVAKNPNDAEGWMLLGRSYVTTGRAALGLDAYQHAYDLTKGEEVAAITGLAEALVLVDESSINGRAGQLFEAALVKQPNDPKALWYGAMVAMTKNDLRTARDRLQRLVAQNPPERIRGLIEQQIVALSEQMGESSPGSGPGAGPDVTKSATASAGAEARPTAAGGAREIKIEVKVSPAIQKQLSGPMTLFVLARDPTAPGPPLAVQRHASTELPLTVTLTERDAMMPQRTIATVPRVTVVARLSHSGQPVAVKGDFEGSAEYAFGKDSGTVHIMIDRTVP